MSSKQDATPDGLPEKIGSIIGGSVALIVYMAVFWMMLGASGIDV